ncbi:hypothetical protein GCM10010299_55080 [Streptomyces tanashiensis]|nr:hypothetical protein GCM10010299_55080 [Streptomyces tanashiensis]
MTPRTAPTWRRGRGAGQGRATASSTARFKAVRLASGRSTPTTRRDSLTPTALPGREVACCHARTGRKGRVGPVGPGTARPDQVWWRGDAEARREEGPIRFSRILIARRAARSRFPASL